MNLNALRALDEEDEIPEPETTSSGSPGGSPLPGESPMGTEPSMGGLPGLDINAPPPPVGGLSSPPL